MFYRYSDAYGSLLRPFLPYRYDGTYRNIALWLNFQVYPPSSHCTLVYVGTSSLPVLENLNAKKGPPLLLSSSVRALRSLVSAQTPRNGQRHVFKTPSRMPNMPSSDHLTNHGIKACPKWLK